MSRSGLEGRRARILRVMARFRVPLGVVAGVWLLATTLLPLYTVTGAVEGRVALAWYTLAMHGSPVDLKALDAVRVVSLAPLALAVYLVTVNPLASRAARGGAALGLVAGGALAFAVVGSAPVALSVYAGGAIQELTRVFAYTSSAGYVWLGECGVAPTLVHHLASPWVYIALSLAYTAAAFSAVHQYMAGEDLKPSGEPGRGLGAGVG